jgi:hypothetical protein
MRDDFNPLSHGALIKPDLRICVKDYSHSRSRKVLLIRQGTRRNHPDLSIPTPFSSVSFVASCSSASERSLNPPKAALVQNSSSAF